MARAPRLDVPGLAQHLVHRGVDRRICFARHWDYARYLDELQSSASSHGCAVHAYVLMTNHVHLLVTPTAPAAISRMMQVLGRRYSGYFNSCHRRTGPLWSGRFKSCLVDNDGYLLRCQRYIDLNPVRAGMVSSPAEYPWSSYRHHALGDPSGLITPHPTYLAIAEDPARRRQAYAEMVAEGTPPDDLEQLRVHVRQGRAWGSRRFQLQIEELLHRSAAARPRGRPSHRERK
jgi:putative transposase